jgi:hypothetical protein
MAHPFLTDEWIAAARQIHEEHRGRGTALASPLRLNLVVLDVPFGDGVLHAHADGSGGDLVLDLGHLEDADVTLTLDYTTARSMLVEQDPQVAMQAFLTGRIVVDGDLAKVLVLQGQWATAEPAALEAAQRVRAITA